MKDQTADNTMFGTSPVLGESAGRGRFQRLAAILGVAVIGLVAAPKVPAAMTDFEGFTTGVSVNYQGPGSLISWYGYTIPDPYGSLWTVCDEWGQTSGVVFDQAVVYDETGTNKVWRLSNAIISGTHSDQPNALSTCVAAGETNAALYNYRGTSHTTPLNPPQPRAYAEQRLFHTQLRFKSATGGAQLGLGVTMNVIPRQTSSRMTYVRIEDPGAGGLNITFIGTGPGGSFPAATTIASGLSYSTWHTLDTYIEFVDGLNPDGSGNDVVTVLLNGTQIHVGTTWETYFAATQPTLSPLAVDTVMFRCAGTAAPSIAGGGLFIDDVLVEIPDFTAPAITCPSDVTVSADSGFCYATGVNLGTPTTSDNASPSCSSVTVGNDAPAQYPAGTNLVTWTATDSAGNSSSCVQKVVVVDDQVPSITCPGNQTLLNTGLLVYTTPTASDNCPGTVTVVCSPASGSTLPPGVTTVTCTATDASGNNGTCSFTVTVTATTALMYNGVFLDVDGNGSSVLTATLSSPLAGCAAGKPILFTVMQGATIVATDTANTDSGGKATVTVPLGIGVYDVIVSFAGDAYCSGSSDSGVLTVASPGDSVYGGGWYKATSAPTTKASFGLVATKKTDRKTGSTYYSGNLVWVHHKKNRLKSTSITAIGTTTVSGYAKSALVSGTGQLSSWIVDGSYLEGGYWSAPVTVGFVATVCDGGVVTVKKVPSDKPDAFGISIGGASIALPGETGPIVLSGGSLKVN